MGLAEDGVLLDSPDETKINVEGAKFDKNAGEVRLEVGQKMIGLTKEELEKYRNDPFWKPVRLVLFILFWVAWVAMFAGAIAIVIMSPKCAEKQQPKWWQTKVSYQLLVSSFYDSDNDGVGDLAGVTEKMDFLRKIGVTTVYPSPVLHINNATDASYTDVQAVMNHSAVDPRFGDWDKLKELVEAAHKKSMFVVVDVTLSTVNKMHPWLQDTTKKDAFHHPKSSPANSRFFDSPASSIKDKYLGFPDAAHAVLNWNSPIVNKTVMGTIKRLLDIGIDGFNFDHVSHLAVNGDGTPDHAKSAARLKVITKEIRDYISTKDDLKDKEIVLFSSLSDMGVMGADAVDAETLNYAVDSSFTTLSTKGCSNSGFTVAQCVHHHLKAALQSRKEDHFHPHWQFSNPSSARLASRFDSETADLLTFMQLTLPGAVSVYYGQEIGLADGKNSSGVASPHGVMQWKEKGDDHHGFTSTANNAIFFVETDAVGDNYDAQFALEKSALKTFQKLARLRQRDEVLIIGETNKDELTGEEKGIVVFSRFLQPSAATDTVTGPVYVVALNFGDKADSLAVSSLTAGVVPSGRNLEAAQVSAVTASFDGLRPHDKIDLNQPLSIPAKQGVLIKI